MKNLFLLSGLTVLFIFSSCEEDELKVPVKVDLGFDMELYDLSENLKSGSHFTIDEAYMTINGFEFSGVREQGESYFFTRNFDDPLQAEMHKGEDGRHVSFDIPQGIYNIIELMVDAGNDDSPAIMLKGRYQQGPLKEIPVQFEYSFREQLNVKAENTEGNRQVILRKDMPAKARIVFDTPSMFRLLNLGQLMKAEIGNADDDDDDSEEIIFINDKNNTDLFTLLASRLDRSLRVVFE